MNDVLDARALVVALASLGSAPGLAIRVGLRPTASSLCSEHSFDCRCRLFNYY